LGNFTEDRRLERSDTRKGEFSDFVMKTNATGVVQRRKPHSLSGTSLAEGRYLWRFELNVSNRALHSFRETLCEEELARADRFRFSPTIAASSQGVALSGPFWRTVSLLSRSN
jgi:hypothetical protein